MVDRRSLCQRSWRSKNRSRELECPSSRAGATIDPLRYRGQDDHCDCLRKLSESPRLHSVQFAVLGPTAPTRADTVSFLQLKDARHARFVGVGFGDYTIAAFTTRDAEVQLTSSEPAVFTLSPNEPRASFQFDLVHRSLVLKVVGSDGQHIDYANVSSLRQRRDRLDDGDFDLTEVPAGAPVLIDAAGWLPACVRAEVANQQVVTLYPLGSAQLRVNVLGGPGRPVGVLEGLPGSSCAVPITSLSSEVEPGEGVDVLTVKGLPEGIYSFRADTPAPAGVVSAPGPPLDYVVPAGCKFCGS